MGNFHNFGFGNYFLDMISKAQITKIKTDKMDFIEIKNHFCTSKSIIQKCKDDPYNGRTYLKIIYLIRD